MDFYIASTAIATQLSLQQRQETPRELSVSLIVGWKQMAVADSQWEFTGNPCTLIDNFTIIQRTHNVLSAHSSRH